MKANYETTGRTSIADLPLGGVAGCQENTSGVPEARSVSHLTLPYIGLLASVVENRFGCHFTIARHPARIVAQHSWNYLFAPIIVEQ
jgi:hypothetical protein